MHILKFEIKKLLSLSMLWGFMLLCLVLNSAIIIGSVYDTDAADYVQYISKTVSVTGTQMGAYFDEALSKVSENEWHTIFTSQTANAEDIFTATDTTELGEIFVSRIGLSGFWEKQMTTKYEKLQASVDKLSKQNASLSVYAAGMTHDLHQLLFSSLFRAITTEACLLAILMMLYALGFEAQNRTELIVYSTRRGRNTQASKLVAGLITSLGVFAIISVLSLLLFFTVFDFSGIWDSSVSSQFNYIQYSGFTKPFLTWIPFTVRDYLLTMVALSAVLTMVFALFGALIGLLCRNTYVGFIIFLAVALCMMALPYLFASLQFWGGYFLSELLPVPLWFCSSQWLTDLGDISLLPWHETLGLAGNAVVFLLLTLFALWKFRRKDIVS